MPWMVLPENKYGVVSLTGVYIAAKPSDKKMRVHLPSILSANLQPENAKNAPIWIQDIELLHKYPVEQAVFIFKEASALPAHFPGCSHCIAVVDASADRQMLEMIGQTMLPAITCGLSSRDTMTLSSIGQDSAVITLQRSICCFDGEMVEAQEIPLQLTSPMDNFTLMAAAAVLIATGNIHLLNFAKF